MRNHGIFSGLYIGYPYLINHGRYSQDSYGYEMRRASLRLVWTARLPRVEGLLPPLLEYPSLIYTSKLTDPREMRSSLSNKDYIVVVDIQSGNFETFALGDCFLRSFVSSSTCLVSSWGSAGSLHIFDFRQQRVIRSVLTSTESENWQECARSLCATNSLWRAKDLAQPSKQTDLHSVRAANGPLLRQFTAHTLTSDRPMSYLHADWHLLHHCSIDCNPEKSTAFVLLHLPTNTVLPLKTPRDTPNTYWRDVHFKIVEDMYAVLLLANELMVFLLRTGNLLRHIKLSSKKRVFDIAYCNREVIVLLCQKALLVMDFSAPAPARPHPSRKRTHTLEYN